MKPVDFGRHSDDYAAYRPGFPASFYRRLNALCPIAGCPILDLGTGPGTIALELGALGGAVLGTDVSAKQVATAQRIALDRDLGDRVRFEVGRAEETGFKSAAFGLVTAGQCWHWFDGPAAFAEVKRLLRPGGALAIAYYSYLAEHSAVARDTESLILERNPSWGMAGANGMYPELVDEAVRSGFRLGEQFCFDHDEEFSHRRWRGRIRTCNGVGSGGLTPAEVERFDADLAQLLGAKYPDPMRVVHRVWCLVVTKPP